MQASSTQTIEFQFMETVIAGDGSETLEPLDVSGATDVVVGLINPSGTEIEKSVSGATLLYGPNGGTDGIMRVKFSVAEFIAGEWRCEGWIQWAGVGSEFYSDRKQFTVHPNIFTVG